ncbi:hypothetical protein [Mycobacteroides abscessus]|uniref:hypothetical protein n=3 Tax=Mycobacteroides abscessus TaxID=36809 RepID=UPI000307C236|nr:hypothetical protein [Mycobacteroides abscessus]
MSSEFAHHPVVLEAFKLCDAIDAEWDRFLDLTKKLQATCYDKTRTVAVTVGSEGDILNLWIDKGSKRHGAATLSTYLNEALTAANAQIAAGKEGIEADHLRELVPLRERHQELSRQIDAGSLALPTDPPESGPTDRW